MNPLKMYFLLKMGISHCYVGSCPRPAVIKGPRLFPHIPKNHNHFGGFFSVAKKTQIIPQKKNTKKHTNHTTKKNTKINTNHTTKKKKHKSYHKKNTQEKTQIIPQKKKKHKKKHKSYHKKKHKKKHTSYHKKKYTKNEKTRAL